MRTELRRRQFTTLLDICSIIDQALDLETTLEQILRILSERLAMQRATITLHDSESGMLSISASYGLTPEEQSRGVYRLGEGVTGRIFQTGEPFCVPDIGKEPLFLNKTGARGVERGHVSFIGVPILLHGDPIGVLNVDRLFEDDIDFEEDVAFLKVVSTLVAQFLSLNRKIMEREEALRRENVSLKSQITREHNGPYIVGRSQAMVEVQRQMEKVAPTRATVLLLGESGVGKSLIARIIHELSDRRRHAFVKVNCASIPGTLLESELFGYERGAFTGASGVRPGRFEDADRGTIFLDEIGELPMGIQAKLQDREFERLGSNRTRRTDVRVIAATNRDLAELVRVGEFRGDLYYRLNVFPMEVPPLRDRKEDVPGLLNHFLKQIADSYGRALSFSESAMEALADYDWPGNVREMENLLERLVIMADSERISRALLEGHLREHQACHGAGGNGDHRRPASLEEMERSELLASLDRNGFIQYKAARELGLSARQMGYRVKKYHLESIIAEGRARLRNVPVH